MERGGNRKDASKRKGKRRSVQEVGRNLFFSRNEIEGPELIFSFIDEHISKDG